MDRANRFKFVLAAALLVSAAPGLHGQDSQQSQPSATTANQNQGQKPTGQQDSLAAAARKAREQKKESPKAAKVFTNDNIPTNGGISSVGAEGESNKEGTLVKAGAEGPQSTTAASKSSASKDEAKWRERFADLRHKLQQDQADLDVMQRELGVLNTQYYSDPTKQMEQQLTRDDINKKTADIETRKKQVEADKQAISDAEDELRKAGGDPGWANPR